MSRDLVKLRLTDDAEAIRSELRLIMVPNSIGTVNSSFLSKTPYLRDGHLVPRRRDSRKSIRSSLKTVNKR